MSGGKVDVLAVMRAAAVQLPQSGLSQLRAELEAATEIVALALPLLQGVRNIAAQSGDSVETLIEYFYDKGGMAEGLFALAELRDRKARDAAVAELIEATVGMVELAKLLDDKRNQPTCSPAYRRAVAALARIGGAP